MKVYEYVVFYSPSEKTEKSKIIVPLTTILANDDKQAAMLAARAIPEDYVSRLDEVEIAVRPF